MSQATESQAAQAQADSAEWALTPDQLTRFSAFAQDKSILVADPNQSIRSSISMALAELGVRATSILLASNYHEAEEQLRANKPEIVICDYHLDVRYGLELVPLHRELCPELERRLFVLVTGNSSESAVAEAAEEDVDAFILKPFTASSIRYYLVRSALAKANPSPYRIELTRGRQLLSDGKYRDAIQVFSGAMSMTPAPSLACYYIGQSHEKLKEWDSTEESYRNGLMFNEIHYRCTVALFDFYVAQNRSEEAYGMVRKLSHHFPISPQRLSKAIELAVRTHNFDDIAYYHTIFTTLNERRDELRKCVCAALVVGAMFHFRHQHQQNALQLLQNAAVTAAGSATTLREIVTMLVKYKLAEPASVFLKRFEPQDRTGSDFLCSEFAVLDLLPGSTAEEVLVRGRKLLKDGVQDPLIHRIMIRREKEVGHADESETLLAEAISIWPDQADSFREAFEK